MTSKTSGKVIIDDKLWTKVKKQFRDIENCYTTIGVHSDTGTVPGANISLAHLAAIHEFGVDITVTPKMRNYLKVIGIFLKQSTDKIHIPERSMLRGWIIDTQPKIKQVTQGILKKILDLKITPTQGIGQLGEFAVSGVKKRMTKGLEPPLSGATLKNRKHGGSKPLIDTAQLIESISHKEVFGERPEGI